MPDKYDIHISPNSWIAWVEPSLTDNPFDIDELLKSTASFWDKLETQCVADCCGIEAFALWPDDIKSAAAVNTEELRNHLETLRTAVLHADSQTVVSDRLNAVFDRGVFVQLIDHLLACL